MQNICFPLTYGFTLFNDIYIFTKRSHTSNKAKSFDFGEMPQILICGGRTMKASLTLKILLLCH